MKLWLARWLVAFTLFLGVSAAHAQESTDASKTWDIVYANAGDAELRLDLVQPVAAREPGPAVLVIHGGAWREGADRPFARRVRRGMASLPGATAWRW